MVPRADALHEGTAPDGDPLVSPFYSTYLQFHFCDPCDDTFVTRGQHAVWPMAITDQGLLFLGENDQPHLILH
jgi:hypothetical protein